MPLAMMSSYLLPWCYHAPCHDVIMLLAMMSSCPLPWCHHAPCHDVSMPIATMLSCPLPRCNHASCHDVIMPLAMVLACPLQWCHHAPCHDVIMPWLISVCSNNVCGGRLCQLQHNANGVDSAVCYCPAGFVMKSMDAEKTSCQGVRTPILKTESCHNANFAVNDGTIQRSTLCILPKIPLSVIKQPT